MLAKLLSRFYVISCKILTDDNFSSEAAMHMRILSILLLALFLTACNTPSPKTELETKLTEVTSKVMTALVQDTTPQATPEATPTEVADYYVLSEEELAALIDESINDTLTASKWVTNMTADYVANGVLMEEELELILSACNYFDEMYFEFEEILTAYYTLYGEYAPEAMAALEEIDSYLTNIDDNVTNIEMILEQGAAQATAAIEQLNQFTQSITGDLNSALDKAEGWLSQVQSEMEQLLQDLLNLSPQNIAQDRRGALQSLLLYADSLHTALDDEFVSADELLLIAQQGADAVASLKAVGGAQLDALADQVTNMTNLIVSGQIPALMSQLEGFLNSLPAP
jgi:hypothetical protein